MNTQLKYLALATLICPALLFAEQKGSIPCSNHDQEHVISCDCENGNCSIDESIIACKKKHPHEGEEQNHDESKDQDHEEASLIACKKKHPHEGEEQNHDEGEDKDNEGTSLIACKKKHPHEHEDDSHLA